MKKNKKIISIFMSFIVIFSIIVIGYSAFNIMKNNKEYDIIIKKNKEIQNEYVKEIETTEKDNNENINKNLKDIDIDSVQKRNKDVIGWIDIPDTGISYPILQGQTNNTYLRKDIDNKYSIAGSIFLEAKNNKDFYDKNSVIYGHNMRKKGDMFHDLRYFSKKDYLEKHNKIYIYLKDVILEYSIKNAPIIDKNDDIYKVINGNTEAQFLYENNINKMSEIEKENNLNEIYLNNQLVLSSCYDTNSDKRNVVISNLTKVYIKNNY